jgi:hypothetical protein
VRHFPALAVCFLGLFAPAVRGQVLSIKPVQFESGTVLDFRLQTRLHASAGDPLNTFPDGTVLQVKMLDSIHRSAEADGVPFRGTVVSSLIVGGRVVIHPGAEVHGIQILLRNRNHPEGFRYELLITDLIDEGESHTITASFDPAFAEASGAALPGADAGSAETAGTSGINTTKPSDPNSN